MNYISTFAIFTANILGIFTDPFEFEGDYGQVVNPIRQQVFELVVSREALAKNLSDSEIRNLVKDGKATTEQVSEYRKLLVAEALNDEKMYGPTFAELASPELIDRIQEKLTELKPHGIDVSDFISIVNFIERYGDQKAFHFLRNNPQELLNLDKSLRDKAASEGRGFDLPILGSTKLLAGNNSVELKKNLIDAVFTNDTFELTKPQQKLQQALRQLNSSYLQDIFGVPASNQDLEVFCSPLGQVFFYWMYQSLNLHLISGEPELVSQVNTVKEIFARTLGDAAARACELREKLIASDAGVLFTQESDAILPRTLIDDGLFLPVDRQNGQSGALIMLRSDMWEPDYQVIAIDGYDGYAEGRMNLILATNKLSGQQFLLASCHGHSTRAEDGRLQVRLVMEKFHQLSDGNLQLFIGMDANTKTEEDVRLFRGQLEALGLTSTHVGPTTVKKRMVTAQHSKAGRFAVDEEDYLITLKPELGGQFQFTQVTVGFKGGAVDTTQPLPNIHNPSDHYPVGAVAAPL